MTSGEEIVDLYLFTWHKHRGVEWRLRGMTPSEALFFVERTEGLGAVGNSLGVRRGSRGRARARAAAAGDGGTGRSRSSWSACTTTRRRSRRCASPPAWSIGQAAAEIALERLLRVNAAAFGHRYLFGVVDIGGGAGGPGRRGAAQRPAPVRTASCERAADALLSTNSFLDRLEATGILTEEAARRLGLVGPVARATGLAIDARADHPAGPYGQFRAGGRRRRTRATCSPGSA